MNVYDFDYTIYNGDSSIDFFLFCLKRQPLLIRYFPKQLSGLLMYSLHKIEKEKFKEYYFSFLCGVNSVDDVVNLFWIRNKNKIYKWYLEQKKNTDVIISASPEFLLKPICKELNVELIATKVNCNNGKFLSKNCYGEEKVLRFRKEHNQEEVNAFYSDSSSDRYLAEIANNAYIVQKGEIRIWDK